MRRRTPELNRMRFLATAVRGTERILMEELIELGFEAPTMVPGGVVFTGTIADGMRSCLWLRTAQRVMALIGKEVIRAQSQLYDAVRSLPLLDWFTADATISVQVQGGRELFADSRYAALVIKDAVVDTVRQAYGRRPNVDKDNADLQLVVLADGDTFRFLIGLNGAPLAFRGYRRKDVEAPIRESLAAALIRYSEWDRKSPFCDPMCGSGTLLVEAGWMATDTAPGILRGFGFQQWPFFEAELEPTWKLLRDEALQRRLPAVRGIILGCDIDRKAVESSRSHLAATGLVQSVALRESNAHELEPFRKQGWIVTNPPYGERIGGGVEEAGANLVGFMDRVSSFYEHTVAMVMDRGLQEHYIARKPRKSLGTFNGPIATRFLVFRNRPAPSTEEPNLPDLPPAQEPPTS